MILLKRIKLSNVCFRFVYFKAVGCDHVLESGVKNDRCGVCGGNGDTCLLEKSVYTKIHKKFGGSKLLCRKCTDTFASASQFSADSSKPSPLLFWSKH